MTCEYVCHITGENVISAADRSVNYKTNDHVLYKPKLNMKGMRNMKKCKHVVQRTSRQDGPETIGSTEHLTSESIAHKDYIIRTDGYSGT